MEDLKMQGSFHLKSLFWGAVLGAVALFIVGFWGFNWHTEGAANQLAAVAAKGAVMETLASVCVEKFKGDENFEANMAALKAESNPWTRKSIVQNGVWAIPPGGTAADSNTAQLCAEGLFGSSN
ncbi:MAG: hypothetical protein UY39_C0003G0020 [Candidatus Kaiserbacteria bacterium GW2011_GWC2_49_12]|uniref:Uncharacterized protein n=4 Tax=Candidatus Kaiseribacteriota TaxID=1752734 RepID=A0A0G1YSH4_9BACT|nr:MAG: hypothetical protein UY39_C0003G0020 [Candidatus Kaiserbacteria bacterium GW2011_GWC2_49_12]KKW17977.1 MAG: hypothetical protein UY57_C0005G0027 [Candidatus Kaiserbacteria bacterium GW2011_GWB1_50_17]KKW18633.1 MAG: hypothetical protein UY59_C0001G0004 [Candidatus Kaiserbacteria bacterium GW2011_GWA1_50_28]HCM43526.1 hypothetical protein [Candidatus Kaiserbacteria bacterium]